MDDADLDDDAKDMLRDELYQLMRGYSAVGTGESEHDRFLKSGRLLEKVLTDYAAPHTHKDWGLIRLIQFAETNLEQKKDGRLYRSARHYNDLISGKSVKQRDMRQGTETFMQAVRRLLQWLGGLCDVKPDFDLGTLVSTDQSRTFPPPEDSRSAAAPTTPRFDTTGQAETPPSSGPATRVERQQIPSLEATDKDPRLTASTVAEYAFCPRAGVVTHESEFSARDEELPSLGALKWFERRAIEQAYDLSSRILFALLVGTVAAIFILVMLPLERVAFNGLLLCCVGAGSYFITLEYLNWVMLRRRQLEAQLATPCMPDPNSTVRQQVNWWGLLLAEFDVRRPEGSMTDSLWKLSGKPHRILKHGDVTVPVHRTKSSNGIVQPQHIVRAMIHCHLILATEGAACPYAIILFGDTYKGTTIPNTRENREQFYSVLERARAMIIETDAGERNPPEPTDASTRCYGCFHGQPRPAINKDKTTRHGEVVDPYFLRDRNGQVFHCSCGDRFDWIPKHRLNGNKKKR